LPEILDWHIIPRMPAVLDRPDIPARLRQARDIEKQIASLEQRLAGLFTGVPKHLLSRSRYGFTTRQMSTIARNLHATAKERIAAKRSKEFRGSVEELI